jgi:hypothetical protein
MDDGAPFRLLDLDFCESKEAARVHDTPTRQQVPCLGPSRAEVVDESVRGTTAIPGSAAVSVTPAKAVSMKAVISRGPVKPWSHALAGMVHVPEPGPTWAARIP